MKRRHNVYISDKTNKILAHYVPEAFPNKSVFIDLCIRFYFQHECELNYYKEYRFILEHECERLEEKSEELEERLYKTTIL